MDSDAEDTPFISDLKRRDWNRRERAVLKSMIFSDPERQAYQARVIGIEKRFIRVMKRGRYGYYVVGV